MPVAVIISYSETKTHKLKLFECKECGYQATVTVGTIMEKTRVDLTKWFFSQFILLLMISGVFPLSVI